MVTAYFEKLIPSLILLATDMPVSHMHRVQSETRAASEKMYHQDAKGAMILEVFGHGAVAIVGFAICAFLQTHMEKGGAKLYSI